MLAEGGTGLLATVVDGPAELVGWKGLVEPADGGPGGAPAWLREALLAWRAEVARPEVRRLTDPQGKAVMVLLEPVQGEPRLVVFGGGHVAQALVPVAAACGFRVTVVDDRPDFANAARFPAAHEVHCRDLSRAARELPGGAGTYVVVVTRGHRQDRECLEGLLGRPFAYLGMIGSRRRVRALREQMAEAGYPREALAELYAPIGVDIGAETPQEIAIAIMAEIIHCRRRGGASPWSLSRRSREG